MERFINQKANFSADFGLVFRSSAIFAILPEAKLTLSIFDYWRVKNGTEISLVASVRSPDGELVSRDALDIANHPVVNFTPHIAEGSVEIEAFANRNLRIPYAAIMGVYETANSVSMVHAYGRNHAPAEIEEGRAVLSAREACISLHQGGARSRAFFHNGNVPYPAQGAKLVITHENGDERSYDFEMPEIAPYETVVFDFCKLAPDHEEFLAGSQGWAALQFENACAFPRLLVCWDEPESGLLQVTHSNFDFSRHQTDRLDEGEIAIMAPPQLAEGPGKVVIYPHCAPATYQVQAGDALVTTQGGDLIEIPEPGAGPLKFTTQGGAMPSRLVTAVRGATKGRALPFECSLGVFHSGRPPKRFHWGVVSARLPSAVYLTTYESLYGEPEDLCLDIELHGSTDLRLTRTLRFESLSDMPRSYALEDLFPKAHDVLADAFGYITIRSNWGGLLVFTSLAKGESLTVEHSF